jgi:single-strand DNA-binding protein
MWGTANFIRSSGTGIQAAAGSGNPGAPGSGNGDDGGPQTQPGDTAGDAGGDAGGDDDGADRHATFINDASGEEEEVDQETGELKGAAA